MSPYFDSEPNLVVAPAPLTTSATIPATAASAAATTASLDPIAAGNTAQEFSATVEIPATASAAAAAVESVLQSSKEKIDK